MQVHFTFHVWCLISKLIFSKHVKELNLQIEKYQQIFSIWMTIIRISVVGDIFLVELEQNEYKQL